MFSKAWIKLGLVVVAAGGMIGLLAYGFTRDARYIQSPLVARQAPQFTLTLFDGKEIRLEDFRGKAVVINFWASWCIPCRAEAPALESAWQKHKERGVVFLGVNIQDRKRGRTRFHERVRHYLFKRA
jgi:thiol-disulfide isomerase/thioredoxin